MRLIDADEFIRWIDLGHLRHPSELCYSEVDVVNMINHQPTAYDVDAVVKDLKKESECLTTEIDTMFVALEFIELNEAIEIVKRGGRNE